MGANETHKHYPLCVRAYRNTSFTPERRALNACTAFDEAVDDVTAAGGNVEKLERLFIAWMNAHSRCASSMITGPANFPVSRNQKANDAEHKRAGEYYGYIEAVKERHRVEQFYAANPHARPISSDDKDALPRLREKLARQEEEHVVLKASPNRASFELANSNARIAATRKRIEKLEKASARTHQEVQKDGYKVVQNVEVNRVQISFDSRPDHHTTEQLKRLGFRWAPSLGVWQRQLTNAGIYAAKQFMARA